MYSSGTGRFNWAFLSPEQRQPTVADHHAGTIDDFVHALGVHGGNVWLVGELTDELATRAATCAHVTVIDAAAGLRRSSALARLAAAELRAGRSDDLAALQPVYLRAPDPAPCHYLFITRMQERDLPGVMAIERQSFPTPWSVNTYRYEISQNELGRYYVVRAARR
ncbi:MAG: hypothetical protein M9927_21190 [Anaerolineae bacterium]|nr:hypothetical protein [Anaerolineae bacterium]